MRTLPFLVSRTRSFVPLWVFSFGITAPYYEIKLFSGKLWCLINNNRIAKIAYNFICKFETKILVGQFAASVEDCEFDFVASFQEAGYFLHLDAEIVFTD